jgi:hypothetical protein
MSGAGAPDLRPSQKGSGASYIGPFRLSNPVKGHCAPLGAVYWCNHGEGRISGGGRRDRKAGVPPCGQPGGVRSLAEPPERETTLNGSAAFSERRSSDARRQRRQHEQREYCTCGEGEADLPTLTGSFSWVFLIHELD